jgi:hypothetical protein
MKRLLLAALLGLLPAAVVAQSPAAAPVQSSLLGVELPAGATISRNGIYRWAARTSLKLDADKAGLKLGDALEVLRIPLTAPAQAELVALIQSGGWTLTMNPPTATWGIAERAGSRMIVEFLDSKRDRWIYVAAIAAPVAGQDIAMMGGAPPPPTPNGEYPPPPAPTSGYPAPPNGGYPPPPGAGYPPPPNAGYPPPAAPEATAAPAAPQAPPAPIAPTSAGSAGRGFFYGISNFDDGWTAQEHPDHVSVTKGPISVLLFYRVEMTDQMRENTSEFFWARDVTPRFDAATYARRQDNRSVYRTEYLEGNATERSTGKPVFIGMNVHRENGRAMNIVVIAPDMATFQQSFPNPNDLEKMMTYNKFAIGPADLAGHWSSNSSVVTQMVYRETGMNAGMNINSSSTEFFVNADGSYTSKHVGAFGMSGTTKVYSDTYTGRYSMNGIWEVTFTNRFNGNADTFAAEFEIVQGGRILHLQNVKASGIRYHLGQVP